jgi:hypothetical protein
LLVVVALSFISGVYLLRSPARNMFSRPPRVDTDRLAEAIDSAYNRIQVQKLRTSTVDLGRQQVRHDDIEVSRTSSVLRANLEITRSVEKAGGTVLYGIESTDDRRRWQFVTLGISAGDSLIREIRLEKRIR